MLLRDAEPDQPLTKRTPNGMEPRPEIKPDDWDSRKIATFSTFHGSSNSHLAGLAVGRGRHAHSRSLVLDSPGSPSSDAPLRPRHAHSRSLVIDTPVRIIHSHSRSLVEIGTDLMVPVSTPTARPVGPEETKPAERTPRPLSRSSARLSGKDAPLRPLSRSSGSQGDGITISGASPPAPPPRPPARAAAVGDGDEPLLRSLSRSSGTPSDGSASGRGSACGTAHSASPRPVSRTSITFIGGENGDTVLETVPPTDGNMASNHIPTGDTARTTSPASDCDSVSDSGLARGDVGTPPLRTPSAGSNEVESPWVVPKSPQTFKQRPPVAVRTLPMSPVGKVPGSPTDNGPQSPTDNGPQSPTDSNQESPAENGPESPTEMEPESPTDSILQSPHENGPISLAGNGPQSPTENGPQPPTDDHPQSPTGNGPESPVDKQSPAANVQEQYVTHEVTVAMTLDCKRFGFSVIGGADERVPPKIDDIAEGSPADKADLEVGDEILEVNGRSLENASHTEVISHIHQCIRSRTICLRVKRKAGNKLALDLAQSSNVQDAFVIAVEQQARERLEKLSALRKIKPVDMTRLSQQLSDTEKVQESSQLNGIIESNSVYVTSVPSLSRGRDHADGAVRQRQLSGGSGSGGGRGDSLDVSGEQLELNQHQQSPRPAVASRPAGGEAPQAGEAVTGQRVRHRSGRSERSEHSDSRRDKSEERDGRKGREGHDRREGPDRREAREGREGREKGERREKSDGREPSESRDSSEGRKRREGREKSETREGRDKLDGRERSSSREGRDKREKHQERREKSARRAHSAEGGGEGSEAMAAPRMNGNGRLEDAGTGGRLSGKLGIAHNDSKRSSKESLSSHKSSGRSSGGRSRASSLEHLQLEDMMHELDRGPHREMAVDVPESFVARTKTPPRYPPPRSAGGAGSGTGTGTGTRPANGTAGRTEPPAPAPRPSLDRSRGSSTASRDSEPSREASERNRKYQDLRRDREMREKKAKEEEFLRSSLRGSEKMKRLEHKPAPTGFVNNGYDAHAHDTDHPGATGAIDESQLNVSNLSLETTILNRLYPPSAAPSAAPAAAPSAGPPSASPRPPGQVNRLNSSRQRAAAAAGGVTSPPSSAAAGGAAELAELLASLKQIQRALRASGAGLQQELAVAQSLLSSPEFRRVLAVHNKVQEIWCFNAPPSALCLNAQDVAQEVVGVLQESSSAEAVELVDLLTRFDMEGLLYSHDQIAGRGWSADGGGEPEPAPALDDYAARVRHYTDPRVRVIRLEKTTMPLGATVKNEGDSVLVGRIVKGGAADKSGLLQPGDEILEVNGIEMRGKSVDDVCEILSNMTGSLVFLALPREEQDEPEKAKPPQAVLHVKAHFDYFPDDDIYMPCRDIALSFRKGDILHVTSQEDPDWWQATRDHDDEDTGLGTLSGLIPSLSFQTQRETLKQSIIDSSRKEGKKNKFLCAKRTNKKKKKMYNAEYNDDYEANEILTYEEVGLYYPRANHKRPVVLIGPPNIGRHELRQKLMEDTDRFSAAVPHTSRPRKETEVDGQDYHFISRPQFEQDIVNRLFVEHGEYERAYYGTSVSAIRAVVNSSKICVLNLHPHSLKILKTTDLKPFVVFVAPPSLEELRQIKLKAGEQVRDDELKQIIEKAREIEEVYGHYFDIIIINSDLNDAYEELIQKINTLERQPQWVPAAWLRQDMA